MARSETPGIDLLREEGLIEKNNENEAVQNQSSSEQSETTQIEAEQEQELPESQEHFETESSKSMFSDEGVREVVNTESEVQSDPFLELLNGRFEIQDSQEARSFIEDSINSRAELDRVRDELNTNQQMLQQVEAAFKDTDKELLSAMQFKKETGLDYGVYNSLKQTDLDSMSAEKAITVLKKIKNPEISNEDLEFVLKNKYKQDLDQYEEREVRLGLIELKEDAIEAKKTLADLKSKIKDPEPLFNTEQKKSEIEQRRNSLTKGWGDVISSAKSQFSAYTVPIDDEIQLQFDLDESVAKEYEQQALEHAIELGLEFNDESYNYLQHYTRSIQIMNDLPRVVKAAYEKGRNHVLLQQEKELSNPSAANAGKVNQDGSGAPVDVSDYLISQTMEKYQGR